MVIGSMPSLSFGDPGIWGLDLVKEKGVWPPTLVGKVIKYKKHQKAIKSLVPLFPAFLLDTFFPLQQLSRLGGDRDRGGAVGIQWLGREDLQ